jgi:hypothetical protein
MRTVIYHTGLYEKQAYCQKERIQCFNALRDEAIKNDLNIEVHTTVNNSSKSYARRLEEMHRKYAEFPFKVVDIGKRDYFIDMSTPAVLKKPDGTPFPLEKGQSVVFEAKAFDIYRLMAEIFNTGMEEAVQSNADFYSIQSGDQLVPPDHANVLVDFLDSHENAGMVGAIVYFDFSKKKMVVHGKEVDAYRPMCDMDTPEKTAWLWANLFPREENGWTGLEFAEVRMCGTGGSMIPRRTFTKLRFHTKWNGTGEDIRFCEEIRSILGKKVFVHTGVSVPNRYFDGQKY